ncbi:MAG: DUF3833 family protein [Rudaea sp.]
MWLNLELAPTVMRRISVLVLLVAFNVAAAGTASVAASVEFTPQSGFGGYSEGNGSLRLLFGKLRPFHVESRGIQRDNGIFRLEQTVNFQGDPPHHRVWLLTTTSPHHYSATLSDAAGSVTGTSTGPHLSLRYRVKGPLVMHQELELGQDGRTIDNVGTMTLLGIPVGHVHETITRKTTGIDSSNPAW